MLQRIQTVWWLASVAALGCLLFVPVFTTGGSDFMATRCTLLAITSGLTILITLVTIFLYSNRKLQVKIAYLLLLLHLAIVFFVVAHFFLDDGEQLSPYAALPVLSFVFQILAIRGVKKDEALIRSMDRLR